MSMAQCKYVIILQRATPASNSFNSQIQAGKTFNRKRNQTNTETLSKGN